ncbi:M48 metallopeptidase family protein [Kineococcus esterisolvens]|uniref:M48 metallopeptidase family protein n=1 Tax=unclassified Kineococcus TaxID=2621656 RepID=UPI003D7F0723
MRADQAGPADGAVVTVTGGAGRSVEPSTGASPPVDVRRSRRRSRTVSAYRDGERTVVLIPARFSRAEEREWVERMVSRLDAADRRRNPAEDDLLERARELSRRHLDDLARPASVTWVDNQQHRWGSCTPADASIRLSTRLQGLPGWVLDYVLLHELAHLLVPTHSRSFWQLLESYPRTERARGFLAGLDHVAGRDPEAEADDAPEEPAGGTVRSDADDAVGRGPARSTG